MSGAIRQSCAFGWRRLSELFREHQTAAAAASPDTLRALNALVVANDRCHVRFVSGPNDEGTFVGSESFPFRT